MKLGLVLEGGASRGLFSCGVMDALLEEEIFSDYVIGVSAGIAYGSSYVSRQIGRNLELSLGYMLDKRYMGFRHILNPKNRSYYNRDFAFRQIPEKLVPFDFDAFKKYSQSCTTKAVLTNLETGDAEYIELSRENWDQHIQTVWASCALPIMFQPEEINGSHFLDGGVSDPIPFEKAIDDGCDKIICVLTRERSYSKQSDLSVKIASWIYKKYPKFAETLLNRPERYNSSREKLFKAADRGDIFVICPSDTAGFARTERSPEKLRELYDDGYNTTKKLLPELRKYLETSK